jgi:hypothetical protein
VDPEEVQELLRGCTLELKSRGMFLSRSGTTMIRPGLIDLCPGLDIPFLLLPFRPTSDPSAARTFVRNFFDRNLHGEALAQELRLTEPMVSFLDARCGTTGLLGN